MVTFEPSLFFFLPRGGKHFLEEGEREKEDKTLQPFFSFRRNLCGQAFPPPPPPPPFSSEAKEIAATTLPLPLFHLHKNFSPSSSPLCETKCVHCEAESALSEKRKGDPELEENDKELLNWINPLPFNCLLLLLLHDAGSGVEREPSSSASYSSSVASGAGIKKGEKLE